MLHPFIRGSHAPNNFFSSRTYLHQPLFPSQKGSQSRSSRMFDGVDSKRAGAGGVALLELGKYQYIVFLRRSGG